MANTAPKTNTHGKNLISFITKETSDHTRGKTWFLGAGVITLLGVLYGIFVDSLSFSLLCILIVGVYTITNNRPAKETEVRITDIGVLFREKLYLYSHIKGFWIFWEPGQLQTLNLAVTEGFFREISIPIEGQDVARIREILAFHIPEVEGKHERITDFIARKLKL